MSARLRIGIAGCGSIADHIAGLAGHAKKISLTAVASRRREKAEDFARRHGIENVFCDWQEMLASPVIDAVYVATPTSVREEISLVAAAGHKHILAEKPFFSAESLERILRAADSARVMFMDATHFTHHSRTAEIKDIVSDSIGAPQALRSSFFTPLMRRNDIRFDPTKEPTGAVGDLAWYCMRAIVEYLQPEGQITELSGAVRRDGQTGAVVRGTGIIVFEDGKSSSFDFGYDTGVLLMDLDILGDRGVFRLDDFVQDWVGGMGFDRQNRAAGYVRRTGAQPPSEWEYLVADSPKPQAAAMLDNFADLSLDPGGWQASIHADLSRRTQSLLDAYWNALRSG